ncbi:phage-related baseplate assembly protein [Vibrio variabilis]|uniref:Phage-related baseplate assembly protein n=1 Tax=Vibrio variabilis TaxID=990271 RepID=A0ABQ0JR54_9VIBR|nr:phage-related baseplate assembly protein [Vibrio variabilis]
MSDIIDLSQYPAPPYFNDETLDAIIQAHFDYIEHQEGIPLDKGNADPATWLVKSGAYREFLVREDFDRHVLSLFITHAKKTALDLIGLTYYQTPRLADEDDERYRARLLLAPLSYSVAGPEQAYRYHALSADDNVLAAVPYSPTPGEVRVAIMSTDNEGAPTQGLIDKVQAYLSADERRPLTDHVIVEAATRVEYVVVLDIELENGASPEVVKAEALEHVKAHTDSVTSFGKLVAKSALKHAAHRPSVVRVTVVEPSQDIELSSGQIPVCQLISIQTKPYVPSGNAPADDGEDGQVVEVPSHEGLSA